MLYVARFRNLSKRLYIISGCKSKINELLLLQSIDWYIKSLNTTLKNNVINIDLWDPAFYYLFSIYYNINPMNRHFGENVVSIPSRFNPISF